MDTLPDEILLHIFGYASTKCRLETISLVCRRWKRVANDGLFTNDDEIVVYENATDFDDLTACVATNERQDVNVYFTGYHVRRRVRPEPVNGDESFYAFWRTCGPKISSLSFDNRNPTLDTFTRILRHCPNLKRLCLKFKKYVDELFENFATRPEPIPVVASVTAFHLEKHCLTSEIDDHTLHKILSVFPNLTNLQLTIVYDRKHIPEYFPFSGLYDYVDVMAKKLRKLKLYVDFGQRPCALQRQYLVFLEKIAALKRVNVSVNAAIGSANILPSLRPQLFTNAITTLRVDLGNPLVSTKRDFLCLLSDCPNLLHLNVAHATASLVDVDVIEKLLASELKVLHVDVENEYVDSVAHVAHNFSANYSLESLTVQGRNSWTTQLWTIFLPHLRKLRELKVGFPNDQILQSIFKYQKCLKRLFVEHYDDCTDFGFTGKLENGEKCEGAYSIRELKELEYLSTSFNWRTRVTNVSFSDFILPKLKCYRAHFPAYCVLENNFSISAILKTLVQVLTNSPYLTIFEFNFQGMQPNLRQHRNCPSISGLDIFLPFVERLKYLRFLHLDGTININVFDEYVVGELFGRCPSLRSFHFDQETFVKSFATGLIKRSSTWRRKRFFKKRLVFGYDPPIPIWCYHISA